MMSTETLTPLAAVTHEPKPMEQLYLLGDRVLVRPAPAPEAIGNIAVPDAHRDEHRLLEGLVLIVGPRTSSIQVGDTVIYGAFNGAKIEVNGEELLVLREDEVLAGWRARAPEADDPAQTSFQLKFPTGT